MTRVRQQQLTIGEESDQDERVYSLVLNYLKWRKQDGHTSFNILNILCDLNLSAEQVSRAIDRLAKEGKIREGAV
ncbi:hypothetical protein HYS54_02570 [Candidatus Micrarchaeota archaeon]|nr:hypothetical protein [Candidatus Micrarchaeota archaeon]